MNMNSSAVAMMVLFTTSGIATAATPDETKQLGTTLTLWGAVASANKDGSIPAYTGGIKPPASYDPSKPNFRPDPFAEEKPLYSITAKNLTSYSDKLSIGTQELLKKYPTFRVDVYPTHRTAKYPQYVLDNIQKNVKSCKLSENRLQLAGECYGGVVFPIPSNGSEVMWNRALKYDQYAYETNAQVNTLVSGGRIVETAVTNLKQTFPPYEPGRTTPIGKDEVSEYLRADWASPARNAGELIIMHQNVDMLNIGSRAWSYLPGQRRVKLSPDLAYDTPNPGGGGIGTMDEAQLFLGSQDRYNFKLVGRKEMIIPYNTFKLHDSKLCSASQLFTPNHMNPDCVRWELHRVWVVEATLKEGVRHIYPRRTFYWDEDVPAVGMSDNYDDAGKIYRSDYTYYYPFYETYGHSTRDTAVFDLNSGAYVRMQYTPAGSGMLSVTPPEKANPPSFYQPSTLARSGVR